MMLRTSGYYSVLRRRSFSPPVTMPDSRGVYSQEFVANGVEKSWSRSYKIIFLVILHIQIKEFNYRLLIMLK